MGFGSYDESEQRDESVDDEGEDAAVNVHENDYQGDVTVENADSTDELIGRLQDIKENDDE